jgi:hypothetical protein
MPGVYEASCQTATTAAAQPIVTISTAAGMQARVREIGIFNQSGVTADIGLGVPAAVGTGTQAGNLVQPLDPSDVAGVTKVVFGTASALAGWGTAAPTVPTIAFRRFQLAATIGAGIVWVWNDNELVIPVSKQIVIWQYTTAIVTFDVYVKLMGG